MRNQLFQIRIPHIADVHYLRVLEYRRVQHKRRLLTGPGRILILC